MGLPKIIGICVVEICRSGAYIIIFTMSSFRFLTAVPGSGQALNVSEQISLSLILCILSPGADCSISQSELRGFFRAIAVHKVGTIIFA
jgi:hypothetical protein